MRKSIIAGNWKMYGSRHFVTELLNSLKSGVDEIEQAELIVFPPFVFLQQAESLLTGSSIAYGAQNVNEAKEGAFTGEIAAPMLKELGCRYVIVGHSERRQLYGETNEQVARKFIAAGKNGLIPVLCVGETKAQRDSGQIFDIIAEQLSSVTNSVEGKDVLMRGAIIAYEPVWAIGTGVTATPEQAQEVHQFIRNQLTKIDKSLAQQLRILYGGSIKRDNAKALFNMPDIDGGLIGGASLNATEFLDIAKLCK